MSESMRKLINLVESMDDRRPRRVPTDPTVPMNMTDFVRNAKATPSVKSALGRNPLHVIRDRELIQKAYQLYLDSFKPKNMLSPAQAILQARESFKTPYSESTNSIKKMFEEDESWRLEGRIKSIETQIESGDIVTGDMLQRIITQVIEGQSKVNDAIQEKMRVGINGLIDLIERDMNQLRAEIEKLK